LPLGDFVPGRSPALARLRELTAAFFGLEAEVLPALDPSASALPGRRNPYDGHAQLDAHAILGLLERRLPADGFALLGLTMVDLYPDPAWNFVFGLASPAEQVGVFSFARYDPAFYGEARSQGTGKLLLPRSCKVLAHETGHLFGLEHCVFYRCLMNGSNHLAESDARPLHLCPVCLRKLQESVGFDPIARERDLLGFARRVGFDDEARWLERRLEHLGSAPD
jgi:archaemetzincin